MFNQLTRRTFLGAGVGAGVLATLGARGDMNDACDYPSLFELAFQKPIAVEEVKMVLLKP